MTFERPRRGDREMLEEDPLYQQLDVKNEERDIFLEDHSLLVAHSSSAPRCVVKLVPMLAADGDPETEVESAS